MIVIDFKRFLKQLILLTINGEVCDLTKEELEASFAVTNLIKMQRGLQEDSYCKIDAGIRNFYKSDKEQSSNFSSVEWLVTFFSFIFERITVAPSWSDFLNTINVLRILMEIGRDDLSDNDFELLKKEMIATSVNCFEETYRTFLLTKKIPKSNIQLVDSREYKMSLIDRLVSAVVALFIVIFCYLAHLRSQFSVFSYLESAYRCVKTNLLSGLCYLYNGYF